VVQVERINPVAILGKRNVADRALAALRLQHRYARLVLDAILPAALVAWRGFVALGLVVFSGA
jgi:hypothetical protein